MPAKSMRRGCTFPLAMLLHALYLRVYILRKFAPFIIFPFCV